MKLNKKGFTLLEIIIVLIIVGVLASLALPRFFSTVEYSRATEALNLSGTIRAAVERCLLNATTTVCSNAGNLDIEDPNAPAGSHFKYTINNLTTEGNMTIVATRTTVDQGEITSAVTISYAADAITRTGTGKFSKIK